MNKAVKYLSITGVIFGLITIISGGSVLLGSNPGYIVFLPLVIFNTVMGFAYIVSGAMAWRNLVRSKAIAGLIFLLNLGALITITYLYFGGSDIAPQSLGAMSFRSIVWLIIYLGFAKAISKESHSLNDV
jgi:hypothetical protein